MYDWLEREIAEIKTRRFHVIDGPAAAGAVGVAAGQRGPTFPRSYNEFVSRFGNARLYRELSYYVVGVLAVPRAETDAGTGETFFRFGHFDSDDAYFKGALLDGDGESPVFQGRGGEWRQVASSFEVWLRKGCDAARRRSKGRWPDILAGPAPFSDAERAIVAARRMFQWRITGVTADGRIQFNVYNGSPIRLPFLSLGIRWKDGRPLGAVKLPVSHVGPNREVTIEHDCYRRMAAPEEVEPFTLPDPEPEDRERYWEFRSLPGE